MSPGWHVRADRSANPSVIAIGDGRCVAAGIRETSVNPSGDWLYNSLGVWTTARDGDSISVAMGAFDWPGRFDKHQLLEQPAFEPLERHAAIGMATEVYLYDVAASDRFAYEDFIVQLAGHLHEPPREGAPLRNAMRDVADALINDGIDPQTGYFPMFRDANGISHAGSLLAYAGILQIARPLIQCGRLLDETRYVQIGSETTDRAVADAFNSESGLFFDMIQEGQWQPNTWWPALEHTALVNGHACYLLLKMYEEGGSIHWAEAARRVLEQALLHQRGDGRFPSGFAAKDGRPNTYTGIAGSYFVAPLLIAYRLVGDIHLRTAALKALEHYWDEFSRLEWIGVELDCGGAVDSTSSYALSRALVELHRKEPTNATLQRLHHVIHYACTFHFAHNTRHRHAACDWSSSGAKITSTHNIHIDAYAGLFLEDVDYYLTKADDPYFRMRLDDATAWARQAYNRSEAEYGWGKVGWVAEQFNHTYVAYFNAQGDGTIWNAYFPWVSGALLAANVIEWKRSIMGEMKGGANEYKPTRVG